jgi:hypothetical protein
MLSEILDALAPGWDGSLIGLLGIAAAGITYALSRQRSIVAYRARGVRLLGHTDSKLPSEVNVQFRGVDIPRLTRTVIVLWNDGEKTIAGSDIVQDDPLCIDVGADASIVACSLLKSTRPVIQATCSHSTQGKSCAAVSFSFLDSGDGMVVEILHTGEQRYPTVSGTIRGIPRGLKNRGKVLSQLPSRLPMPVSRRTLAVVVLLTGIAFAIVGTFYPQLFARQSTTEQALPSYAILTASALYVSLGGLMLWMLRRRYPRALHTEELE